MGIQTDIQDHVAVIRIDFPPVNGIGAAFRAALSEAVAAAEADPAVQGIVITGTERAFSAGADVKEFGTPAATREPRLATVIAQLESCNKPVVAAVQGVCLGGGLELALGAHFRVAREDARLGLPEVKLGILPGAGGTQRFPRAVGVSKALDLIVSGKIVRAATLRETALFEVVSAGDPVPVAVQLCHQVVSEHRPLKRLRDVILAPSETEAVEAFRNKLKPTRFPAPMKCIEAVRASIEASFDEGLRREREAFEQLIQSPESRALRHAFAAERAAAHFEGMEQAQARDIQSVGVIGAGTMGRGIAMACANAGLAVLLIDASQEALEKAIAAIRKDYQASAAKGRITASQVEERVGRIQAVTQYEALGQADLVIEAVFEDMKVKRSVFERLDKLCKPGAILATNTSFLDVDEIAACTSRPESVLGLHFFSPAHIMRLVEVVRGARTSTDVLATALAFVRRISKVGVVAGVCDGFIGNRMGFRYTATAFDLVRRGAEPQEVDRALEGFGMAMGPLRMGDLAGLDIGWATRKRKAQAGAYQPRVVPDALCEQGRFGQKTGAGWYRYEEGSRTPMPDPETDRLIEAFRREQGVEPRHFEAKEIVERCIFALVNEGAKLLDEGIAARASDIDVVYLNGYGFPAHIGGPMLYADQVGLDYVLNAVQRFAAESGADPSWQPAQGLVQRAGEGRTFN